MIILCSIMVYVEPCNLPENLHQRYMKRTVTSCDDWFNSKNVLHKKFESSRRLLTSMRRVNIINEISQDAGKNNSWTRMTNLMVIQRELTLQECPHYFISSTGKWECSIYFCIIITSFYRRASENFQYLSI